jgi:5'-deoxynucleotidase YfbR-like HD superfamily hydrolase
MRAMAIETFKIFHDMSPAVITDLIVKKTSGVNFKYTEKYAEKYIMSQVRSCKTFFKKNFTVTAEYW